MILLNLQVIKKVMKMDAAEPFNVPVNPEALGIPVSISYCCEKMHLVFRFVALIVQSSMLFYLDLLFSFLYLII